MKPSLNPNSSHDLRPGGFSAFTIIVIFVVLIIAGISLIPHTSFKLLPTRTLPSITVNYQWPNISGRVIEMQVTGPLEGAFSTVRGIKEITSESQRGRGRITISFDKSSDMDAVRFEIATLIRQVYPGLPDGVTRPVLTLNRPGDNETALITYTINASASLHFIGRYAEDVIRNQLSDIQGVYSIYIHETEDLLEFHLLICVLTAVSRAADNIKIELRGDSQDQCFTIQNPLN